MPWAAIGAAAAPVVGSIIGSIADDGDQDAARAAKLAALQQLQGINVPTIEEQSIALQKLQQQGELTPEMLQTFQNDPSLLANISTDPRLKDASMQALDSLTKQGQTGLTDADRSGIVSLNKGIERDTKGRNDAILQALAAKGMGGSGAELAAQLANSQSAADQAQTQGNNILSQAQQKALQAVASAGTLGSQLQSQDFNQQAQQASAQDAINKFNTQNKQTVAGTNVAAKNAAQATNLSEKQRVADANTGLTNQQEIANKALYQTKFNNDVKKATGVADQENKDQAYYDQQAKDTRGMWAGIGQGVGQAASGMSGATGGTNPLAATKTAQLPASQGYMMAAHGGVVPGEPSVPGDSLVNDTQKVLASPGEVILPHSILNSSDDAILAFIKLAKKK